MNVASFVMNVSNFFSATFLVTGVTIGAGILGLPYAYASFGTLSAVLMVCALGGVSLVLNLMIGDVAYALKKPHQLPGLAREVLGPLAQYALSVVIICAWLGSLLAYIVGGGQVLSALFGGTAWWWGVGFWLLASSCVLIGFGAVTRLVRVASLSAITLFVALSVYALQRYGVQSTSSFPFTWNSIGAAFGATLFALHGTPAIAEARELLRNDRRGFRWALIVGTVIPVAVYSLFICGSLAAGGGGMTPVATVALGNHLGPVAVLAGTAGALIAMFSCYMGIATALRETLSWDSRFPRTAALAATIFIPFFLFLVGIRDFSRILAIVGGVFLAFEAIIMIGVYISAVKKGIVGRRGYSMRHPWVVAIPLVVVFAAGAVASFFVP